MTSRRAEPTETALDWQERAACRRPGVDPELFWREGKGRGTKRRAVAPAKAVCADCPVRSECLTYALGFDPPGVWGGTTEEERKALRGVRS